MTQEEFVGPTPAGGVRSVIYYQSQDGSPVEKSEAVRAEAVEYNSDGEVIQRTYLVMGHNNAETNQ